MTKMKLPSLTPLQFAVLRVLARQDQPGRSVREALAKEGIRKSGPAFYQLMSRMEDAGYVTSWQRQKVVAGQSIRETNYRILMTGQKALEQTRAFYAPAAPTTD